MIGILCGKCRDGKGVSVLLNDCVSCHDAQGLLILGLSKLNQSNGECKKIIGCVVIADAVAFIVIVVADVPFPEWIYPFIFYIQAS